MTLGVRRGDQQVAAALTTIAPQEGTTGSLLGLSLKISVDSKVDATFGLSDVGGPSAGMMFALGVVDEITPGALTGGKDISGTGRSTSTARSDLSAVSSRRWPVPVRRAPRTSWPGEQL